MRKYYLDNSILYNPMHLYEISIVQLKSLKITWIANMKKFLESTSLEADPQRFIVRTSGGRSGSRANSRPWHVSHALRHFRRIGGVPTRLLSRMRAGCVSRDAQGLSMPVNGFSNRGAWDIGDGKFFCRWCFFSNVLIPEWKLWEFVGESMRGISVRGFI